MTLKSTAVGCILPILGKMQLMMRRFYASVKFSARVGGCQQLHECTMDLQMAFGLNSLRRTSARGRTTRQCRRRRCRNPARASVRAIRHVDAIQNWVNRYLQDKALWRDVVFSHHSC